MIVQQYTAWLIGANVIAPNVRDQDTPCDDGEKFFDLVLHDFSYLLGEDEI